MMGLQARPALLRPKARPKTRPALKAAPQSGPAQAQPAPKAAPQSGPAASVEDDVPQWTPALKAKSKRVLIASVMAKPKAKALFIGPKAKGANRPKEPTPWTNYHREMAKYKLLPWVAKRQKEGRQLSGYPDSQSQEFSSSSSSHSQCEPSQDSRSMPDDENCEIDRDDRDWSEACAVVSGDEQEEEQQT